MIALLKPALSGVLSLRRLVHGSHFSFTHLNCVLRRRLQCRPLRYKQCNSMSHLWQFFHGNAEYRSQEMRMSNYLTVNGTAKYFLVFP